MTLEIITIDPDFFKGSDATNHMCEGCGLRVACHVHHKKFKQMGGSHGAAKKLIEDPSNKMDICLACHDATHGIHSIMADGHCCDLCPKLKTCFYGSKLLRRPYLHLTPRWGDPYK